MINDKIIEEAASIGKEVAVPLYKDVVHPVAQEVGKALKTIGGVINVALSPISLMVYGFEKIQGQLQNRLEKRLSMVLPENIVSPPLQIVGPLIEKYKYIYDNENLSEMFINLLAKSMDKDTIEKAHPSFVNIISELSSDEAKLIKHIYGKEVLPKLDVKLELPVGGYKYIITNFSLLGNDANLAYPELTPSYLNNLERLNIIYCSSGGLQETYTDKNCYKLLKENKLIQDIQQKFGTQGKIELMEGVIRITDFGGMFIEAVL